MLASIVRPKGSLQNASEIVERCTGFFDVHPGFKWPITTSHHSTLEFKRLSSGSRIWSAQSGMATSNFLPTSRPVKFCGCDADDFVKACSRVSFLPIAEGSAANSVCQNACPSTTPGEPQPRASSASTNRRPSAGCIRVCAEKIALTSSPKAKRASPLGLRFELAGTPRKDTGKCLLRWRISSQSG